MATWIDFRALRRSLRFENVLRHYKVEIKAKGNQHHGFCPLPNHTGQKHSQSFSANLEKGIFQCFGCGAKGNLLDFAVLMERGNPEDGNAIRETALKLQEAFRLTPDSVPTKNSGSEPKAMGPTIVNAPLDF